MPAIPKEEIIKRLNRIPDFKEYSVIEDSLIGTSKKAKFKHTVCGYEFQMIVKDFFRRTKMPTMCSGKKNH